MRPVNRQVIQHDLDVVGRMDLRIGSQVLRHVRWRITSSVECNTTISLAEVPHLRLPTPKTARKFVHEHKSLTLSGFLIVESNPVLCGRVRPSCLGLCRWADAALSALVLLRHRRRNRSGQCHRASCRFLQEAATINRSFLRCHRISFTMLMTDFRPAEPSWQIYTNWTSPGEPRHFTASRRKAQLPHSLVWAVRFSEMVAFRNA